MKRCLKCLFFAFVLSFVLLALLLLPTFAEGESGSWLFENEALTTELRTDLPAPVGGVSYTLFVDGEEMVTKTCESSDSWFMGSDDGLCVLLYGSDGWYFHPVDSAVTSGTVSIRINDNLPKGDWLFQDQVITTEGRTDLPAISLGTTYIVYVNGEEYPFAFRCSQLDSSNEFRFDLADGLIFVYNATTGVWYSCTDDPDVKFSVFATVWLFEWESITFSGTNDLPALVDGVKYTFYAYGVKQYSFLYDSAYLNSSGEFYLKYESVDVVFQSIYDREVWYLSSDVASDVIVSIRIDSSSTGTPVPGPEYPVYTEGWLFKDEVLSSDGCALPALVSDQTYTVFFSRVSIGTFAYAGGDFTFECDSISFSYVETGSVYSSPFAEAFSVFIGAIPEGFAVYEDAYQDGFGIGRSEGHQEGYREGIASVDQAAIRQEGYDNGYDNGYDSGYLDGCASVGVDDIYKEGYDSGYESGYSEGYASVDQDGIRQEGYDNGYSEGYASVDQEAIKKTSYDSGYSTGRKDAELIAETGDFSTLFTSVIDAPVRALTSLLDFEILGQNMLAFFGALLSLCLILFILKKVI